MNQTVRQEEHDHSLSSNTDYVTLDKGLQSLSLSCLTCTMGRIPTFKGYSKINEIEIL